MENPKLEKGFVQQIDQKGVSPIYNSEIKKLSEDELKQILRDRKEKTEKMFKQPSIDNLSLYGYIMELQRRIEELEKR
jgi:hypothetical protein